MYRRSSVALVTLALAIAAAPPVAATSVDVAVAPSGSLSFSPRKVALPLGGTVVWSSEGGGSQHSVHQVRGLFDSGQPTSQPFDFERTFSAGTFPYVCEIHPSMTGTITARTKLIADHGDGTLPLLRWALAGSNTGTKFDVQYRVGKNRWRSWLRDASAFEAVFGDGNAPVTVKAGKTYRFRARSQKGTKVKRVSAWSPVRKYVHD